MTKEQGNKEQKTCGHEYFNGALPERLKEKRQAEQELLGTRCEF